MQESIVDKAHEILRSWALEFHESGDFDDGVKIVFDGYLEDDDGFTDESQPCYAIFIHKDSLKGNFPEHSDDDGYIGHRPDQEICFYVWLNIESAEPQEIAEPTTELNLDDFYKIILAIEDRYQN